jgi:lysophospholipase L1-like esterase
MAYEMSSRGRQPSRRDIVRAGAGLGAAGLASLSGAERLLAVEVAQPERPAQSILKPGDVVLFQGDSITDAKRDRKHTDANSAEGMGTGYAWFATSQILVDAPDAKLKFYNRGISGNKVYQLAERWQADCLDLKPNVLSILIGVNDFAHMLKGDYKGTVETYETDYRAIVKRSRDALPEVRLVICEPFVLKTGNVTEKWFPGYDGYRAAAKRIAEESQATFVPFQKMFDIASEVASPATWAADGVHPTASGSALMAHWWMKSVGA